MHKFEYHVEACFTIDDVHMEPSKMVTKCLGAILERQVLGPKQTTPRAAFTISFIMRSVIIRIRRSHQPQSAAIQRSFDPMICCLICHYLSLDRKTQCIGCFNLSHLLLECLGLHDKVPKLGDHRCDCPTFQLETTPCNVQIREQDHLPGQRSSFESRAYAKGIRQMHAKN